MNATIRAVAHFVLEKWHHFIGYLLPINKNKVFFDSFPDYSDNSRAMSDYLLEKSNFDIFWAVRQIPVFPTDPRIHFILKSDKWKYIYHTLTSKYLFSTHGAFSWANPKRQMFVCLWHGTPAKKVCLMQDPTKLYYLKNCTFFTAASEYAKEIFIKAFGRKQEEIIVTGYPRCDLLFQENSSLKRLGVTMSESDKLILYLPTFRKPIGGGYSDSSINVFEDNFINFSDFDSILTWNNYFKDLNIIFIIKPHPSESYSVDIKRLSNIKVVTNSQMQESDIHLYSLMHFADAIVTDFSSVYFDYLLLNRPIGFMIFDIDEFNNNRGSIVENPLDIMPGEKITTEREFKVFCSSVVSGNDRYGAERMKMQKLFNKYIDSKSCERIFNYVIKKEKI